MVDLFAIEVGLLALKTNTVSKQFNNAKKFNLSTSDQPTSFSVLNFYFSFIKLRSCFSIHGSKLRSRRTPRDAPHSEAEEVWCEADA